MRRQDFRQPDLWQHFKKTLRRYWQDLRQRLQRVDIRAMAADWAVTGVDMSYWQGAIKDKDKLAGMVDFIIIRAGYGNDFIDPRLEEYRQFCIEYKVPFGLYWFPVPGKSFEKHALNFFSVWEDNPGVIYPTFDLEVTGGLAKTPLESWWSKLYAAFNSLAGRDLEEDMTYTSPGFLNKVVGLTSWLKRTLLFVAHWTLANLPSLPLEWLTPGKSFKFWQWSSTGKGDDYGLSSRYVDLVRYNGSKAQFEAEFGVVIPDPDPGGDEMIFCCKITKLNVRTGPGTTYADVGDLYQGDEFAILNVKAGTPVQTIWVQIKGGQYDGKWVCLYENGAYYLEPAP